MFSFSSGFATSGGNKWSISRSCHPQPTPGPTHLHNISILCVAILTNNFQVSVTATCVTIYTEVSSVILVANTTQYIVASSVIRLGLPLAQTEPSLIWDARAGQRQFVRNTNQRLVVVRPGANDSSRQLVESEIVWIWGFFQLHILKQCMSAYSRWLCL